MKFSRQPYYRWLHKPITDAEIVEVYRANALFDAHQDDPEFGVRILADEAREAGEAMSEQTAWQITSANGWWSLFGKKKDKGAKPGPPVHDDLSVVTGKDGRTQHVFTATSPNQVWLTDMTEHWADEGKLYICAVKDLWGNKILGYSIGSQMKSSLVVRRSRTPSPCAVMSPGASFTATADRNSGAGSSCTP